MSRRHVRDRLIIDGLPVEEAAEVAVGNIVDAIEEWGAHQQF